MLARRLESAVVIRPSCFAHVVPSPQAFAMSGAERVALDRLRWLAIRARLRGGEDLERACLLLGAGEDETFERYGLLFFNALQRHARHDLAFHRPGAKAPSAAEIWLLRLFRNRGDRAMFVRMIAWQVEPRAQRWLRFLATGLAQRLEAADLSV